MLGRRHAAESHPVAANDCAGKPNADEEAEALLALLDAEGDDEGHGAETRECDPQSREIAGNRHSSPSAAPEYADSIPPKPQKTVMHLCVGCVP